MTLLLEFLKPPKFDDEDKSRRARQLNVILLSMIFMNIVVLLLINLIDSATVTSLPGSNLALSGSTIVMTGLGVLIRRGYVRVSSFIYLLITWATLFFLMFNVGGLHDVAYSLFVGLVLVAGLLLGWRAAVFFTALILGSGFILLYLEAIGQIVPVATDLQLSAIFFTIVNIIIAILLYLMIDSLNKSLQNARQSNQELQVLSEQLEKQVRARTQALETSLKVSRDLATILDQKALMAEVVNQVQSAFNYYHAHIYLLDERGENLMLVGGTGEAGQKMLANGHQVPVGKGLVGRAALSKDVVLVPDVAQEEDWLPNPLLPETKAETAVPIIAGDRLLGVLDVQHNIVDGLQQLDVDLLTSVANQTAVGLQNAQAYSNAQGLASREAIINDIGRQIQKATDVETVLQVAARELAQKLGTSRATIEIGRNYLVENGRITEQN